ncbi:hypothetical protein BU26DRAFT_570734 [Trematosphaeria pertusa]|uniref:Uncharacterized protein n=1 Tax=Trematosphaeria pertusa TaxID=390896 RepID=A0A6A6HXB8_9PLEO|nr:uncharacterized protein BU26DRAFT_570734 [Trematosphaeria pertusa]KAF2242671.1 hypothetical protein BU26DRAFT_570734 [Trematosphaeria pertusa]
MVRNMSSPTTTSFATTKPAPHPEQPRASLADLPQGPLRDDVYSATAFYRAYPEHQELMQRKDGESVAVQASTEMKSPLANHEECAGQAPDSSISEVPGAYPEVAFLGLSGGDAQSGSEVSGPEAPSAPIDIKSADAGFNEEDISHSRSGISRLDRHQPGHHCKRRETKKRPAGEISTEGISD